MRFRPLLAGLVGLAGLLAFACTAPSEDTATDEGELIDLRSEPMSQARLDAIVADRGIRSLDQVPGALPKDFLINVTLKHGRLFEGERGHLVERVVSQSADPKAPRAILWDERSGFNISYNGGAPGQTAGQRLDIREFDEVNKVFHLAGLEFNGSGPPVYKTDANIAEPNQRCAHCHGKGLRPIFSMYPDWPSFYGSDNDELTDMSKPVQEREAQEYAAFRSEVETRALPRYLPLFDRANIRQQLRGTELYPSYPYRQDTNTHIEAVSRSFAFRPSLRFGILENRLMAQVAAKQITEHANFDKFGAYFLHDLLECRWPSASSIQSTGWSDAVKAAIGRAPRTVAGGKTLHYRDLLQIFGLEVKDIDIRYSYNHEGYANENATNKVMEVGYIDGSYWNSYFDGSATIDELIAMHLYNTLSATPELRDLAGTIDNPDGLVVKYSRRAERFRFDKNFFEEMDRKGQWIPIPYPRERLDALHHREGYPARFANQHRSLCQKLEAHLQSVPGGAPSPGGDPGEAAACPASCVASEFCRTHPNASQAIKVNGLPCMVAGAGGCQPCR